MCLLEFPTTYQVVFPLQVKEDKASGDVIIGTINRKHATYTDYRPYKSGAQQATASAAQQESAAAGGAAGGGDSGGGGSGGGSALCVEEVWRPGRELRPVLEALGAK